MNFRSCLLLAIGFSSFNTHAVTLLDLIVSGSFTKEVDVIGITYDNQSLCESDKGIWSEEEFCVFKSENKLSVKPIEGTKKYEVEISTITTNFHTCDYSGEGQAVVSDDSIKIKTSQPSTDYEQNEKGEYVAVDVMCELEIIYQGEFASVTSNGKCSDFCGARAFLEISQAQRK